MLIKKKTVLQKHAILITVQIAVAFWSLTECYLQCKHDLTWNDKKT